MTATSVVCPECGSPVAPGRLSCQSCGTLLASVVGSSRPPLWAAAASAELSEVDEDRPIASARRAEADVGAVAAAGPVAAAEASGPMSAPKRAVRRLPRPKAPAAPAPPARGRYVRNPLPAPVAPIDQTALFGPVPNVAPPILHDWSDRPTDPVAAGSAVAPGRASIPTAPSGVAGAYLAPSATYTAPVAAPPVPERGSRPRPDPAAAPSWPTALQPAPPAVAHAGNGASSAPAMTTAPAAPTAPPARKLAGWLVIGGSTLAIVSFVLPWATGGVIGVNSGTGYLADWGLANPGHLLLVAAALAVLIVELVENPVPAWFRSGVLPLLVGGVLAGLAFAYYARLAGGGAGVAVMLAGALVMIGGGFLASRPDRHGSGAPSV